MTAYRGLFIALTFLAVILPSAASASVIYSYTGNPYTSFGGTETVEPQAYDTSMFVSGFFEIENPLAPNMTDADDFRGLVPLNASFSDGVTTIDYADATLIFLSFNTNAAGEISNWSIEFDSAIDVGPGETFHRIFSAFMSDPTRGNADLGRTHYCREFNSLGNCRPSDYHEAFSEVPGTWTVSEVPLPAGLWLFASGIMLLAGLGKKRLPR